MCGAVPPRVISGFHGDIRLESASGDRKTDEYCVWTFVGKRTRKFVVHRARTPDGQHMRTLAGRRLLSSTAGERGFARFLSLL